MQPYRKSEFETVKLRTPINLGPLKRSGQSLLVVAPPISIFIATMAHHMPLNDSLGFVLAYTLFAFISWPIMFMLDAFKDNERIVALLKIAWWPIMSVVAVLYILYSIGYTLVYGIGYFGKWIVRG